MLRLGVVSKALIGSKRQMGSAHPTAIDRAGWHPWQVLGWKEGEGSPQLGAAAAWCGCRCMSTVRLKIHSFRQQSVTPAALCHQALPRAGQLSLLWFLAIQSLSRHCIILPDQREPKLLIQLTYAEKNPQRLCYLSSYNIKKKGT